MNRFSKQVTFYSFFLSLLVVLLHGVNLAADDNALAELVRLGGASLPACIQNFFSNTLGQAAVPGFFLLSAYLFYRTLPSLSGIPGKWRRRIFSLLIPYCVWNFLYYLLYALCGRAGLSLPVLAAAVLQYRFNPVFWYLWQLILLTMLAPVLYFLTTRLWCGALSLGAVLLLVYFQIDLPLVNEDALFYYLLGACWARHGQLCFEGILYTEDNAFGPEGRVLRKKSWKALLCALGFLAAAIFCAVWRSQSLTAAAVRPLVLSTVLYRASLAQLFWFALACLPLPTPRPWMRESFLLYALHYPIVRLLQHILSRLPERGMMASHPEGLSLLFYALAPVLSLLLTYGLSRCLRRFFPGGYRVLSGGR